LTTSWKAVAVVDAAVVMAHHVAVADEEFAVAVDVVAAVAAAAEDKKEQSAAVASGIPVAERGTSEDEAIEACILEGLSAQEA